MLEYKSFAGFTAEEYEQWLKEFYKENGPKPDVYDFQDFIEDDTFNLY